MMRSILTKSLLAIALYLGLQKTTHHLTGGFREEKITRVYENANWDIENSIDPKVLEQPFRYLGSGKQSYVFLSEDGTTVLKCFKHYHFGLPSHLLTKLPFTQKALERRQARVESIFSSAMLSGVELKEQTKVESICLNAPKTPLPKLTVYDKIGVLRTIDLNRVPFILQTRADEFLPYMKKHPEKAKELIAQVTSLVKARKEKGIQNTDPHLFRNLGVIDDQLVELDIGSFTKSSLAPPKKLARERGRFREWVTKHVPDAAEEVDALCLF